MSELLLAQSILTSIKKLLDIDEDDNAFDTDVVMHINSALGVLGDLGIGPEGGFMIENADPTWYYFLGEDVRYQRAKLLTYQIVKLGFDPPDSAFAVSALERLIEQNTFRISVQRESTDWVDPNPSPAALLVINGGTP